ncbi:fibronectin type III domain-containing protein 10 [Sceloporus undulatus]|uniref:fibronectin type III domain-containing protein 10 n=1 Tax=Sceloporus undulatus TaxID=8520 RepID=UPI001C4AF739|nr:fibronectin type III domain-containing protein 10 [Sceloporus undulatus]XP_042335169.1 fibronectin type III domain-containing protein 10 [Sceloporus undulatus]
MLLLLGLGLALLRPGAGRGLRPASPTAASSSGPMGLPSSGSPAWCPYKVQGQDSLCFRSPALGFECGPGRCLSSHRSPGRSLLALVLRNGSVLLQWQSPGPGEEEAAAGGFRLSCSWAGAYTRFPCESVLLGAACRDFLLPEAHPGARYRLCLQALPGPATPRPHPDPGGPEDCVEFPVEASGPREMVVAVAAVGGAICVMLVLICLLVAYLTENMAPSGPKRAP